MREPFDVTALPALLERAAERTLAVRNLLLKGLDGEPVHITPSAFWLDLAYVCSQHPMIGLTTGSQFRAHLRRHHPANLDECPHCGWDLRVVEFDTFTSLDLPDPIQVVIIKGVWTKPTTWRGTVRFQWVNDVCPQCRSEVVR